jgi:ribonuclease D
MIIQTQQELTDLCESLGPCQAIALDTEFNRTQTYRPILSLVQLSDGNREYIIDFYGAQSKETPLDPAPLINLLLDLNITKIVHSCRQDFEIFMNEWGILPQNVFDTQIAASLLLPDEEIGLAKLLKQTLEIDLNKAQQKTNWMARPLSKAQLNYALSDVQHLHNLWEDLGNKLEVSGRLGWLWEDQHPLLSPPLYKMNVDHAWKKVRIGKAALTLKPRSLLYLQHLCRWRELKAQALNVNRKRILADEMALAIAQTLPKMLDHFAHTWPHLKKEYLLEIWDILQCALQIPRENWPKIKQPPILSYQQSLLLEKIKEKQEEIASQLHISPRILANNEDLKQFCRGKCNLPFLKGWRHQEFGTHCERIFRAP